MNAYRKTAVIIGVLYIIGTVSGILSAVVTAPIRNALDPLIGVSAHQTRIVLGALLVFTMGLALAMVPVMAYPVLKKHNPTLAIGYVVFRGGLETVTYMATAVSWLLLLPLGELYRAGTPDAANLKTLGASLLEAGQISSVCTVVFILGALMFYSVLLRSRLVPRWLLLWGLIAAVPYLTADLLGMFGLIDASLSSDSVVHTIMVLPLAVQEMVLAVWLIVKGFNPSAIGSET